MSISIWWAIPALAALFGFLLVGAGLGRMFRFRVMSGLSRFLFGGVFLGGAGTAVLFGLNIQTYARLVHERPAAEVTLYSSGEQMFKAVVRTPGADGDLTEERTYDLTGDEFRVEARFLKWKPWANITGYDSVYRLDRIEGRFEDVAQERASPPTPYNLAPEGMSAALDVYQLARKNNFMKSLDAVDAIYGAGAYAPMADGAVFEIMATQSGLIPRPANDIARQAALDAGKPIDEAPAEVAITGNADAVN